MTRALVTQLLDCLVKLSEQSDCDIDPFTFGRYGGNSAVTAAREYLATEPKPTLTEALAQQGIKLRTEFEPKQRDSELAAEPRGERAELIARLNECLSGPAALTTREATAIKDAADMLEAKRVPMAGEEIEKIADGCRAVAGSVWPHAFARAIEAHHGITPK